MLLRDDILHQALALSPADQAFVVNALQQHLNSRLEEATAADVVSPETSLLTELRQRSAAYASGQTSARDAVDVLADLRRRQSAETGR